MTFSFQFLHVYCIITTDIFGLFLCIYHFILWIYILLASVMSMMPTCHFLLFLLSLLCRICRLVISSLPSLNVQFTVSSSQPLLFNYLNSRTCFKFAILRHLVKLRSFSFHESNTVFFLRPVLFP